MIDAESMPSVSSSAIKFPAPLHSTFRATQLSHSLHCIDLFGGLILSQPENSGKPQRVPALVALRFLHAVEGHLQNDFRFDYSHPSVCELLNVVGLEPLRHLQQLRIGQS